MEELFKSYASRLALIVEVIAALVITYGALQAVIGLFQPGDPKRRFHRRKVVWLNFGVWLLLGLEFELAADIVRSAIAPSWNDIGQLGAIAVIRTFLNYFLERDVDQYIEPKPEPAKPE